MDRGRLQRLLWTDEFCDFEDLILVEGGFVELDKSGCALRQVYLGLTGESLLLAQQILPNYKEYPEAYFGVSEDLELEGLIIRWILPICFVTIEPVPGEYILKLDTKSGRRRYYQLNTSAKAFQDIWERWMERLRIIRDDPYGFIKNMYKDYGLVFEKDETSSIAPHNITIIVNSESDIELNLPTNQSVNSKSEANTKGASSVTPRRKLTLTRKVSVQPQPCESKGHESIKRPAQTPGRRNAMDERSSFSSAEDVDINDVSVNGKRNKKKEDRGRKKKQKRDKTKTTKKVVVSKKDMPFIRALRSCFNVK